MHKIALLRLAGYREWTESLGPWRERLIQLTQARIHAALWSAFTAIGALPHHFRYDYLIALANNVRDAAIRRVARAVSRHSPVAVELCIGRGETPLGAYASCGRGGDLREEGEAVVAHVDIAGSTRATSSDGPLSVYLEVVELMARLGDECKEVGCMVFYLGGDNMMAFLPDPAAAGGLLRRAGLQRVRAGVGVSERPYDAFSKATRALDYLRRAGREGVKVVK